MAIGHQSSQELLTIYHATDLLIQQFQSLTQFIDLRDRMRGLRTITSSGDIVGLLKRSCTCRGKFLRQHLPHDIPATGSMGDPFALIEGSDFPEPGCQFSDEPLLVPDRLLDMQRPDGELA